MNTHNIRFYGETYVLWRNKQNYPLIITKYPPYLSHWYSYNSDSVSSMLQPLNNFIGRQ